jgi:hypothetical protein
MKQEELNYSLKSATISDLLRKNILPPYLVLWKTNKLSQMTILPSEDEKKCWLAANMAYPTLSPEN